MLVLLNETGIAPSRSRSKQYAEEFRYRCSCGERSGAHPIRSAVVRSAERHELLSRGEHVTTIQKR